jgi:putative ABC transport system permease protein
MLSVGFIVTIIISSLSFLLYALLSVRQQLSHFGILRALGLSVANLTATVALEYLVLGIAGTIGGALIGVLTSRLYIPLLQVGMGAHGKTPPFLVSPAWDDMARVYLVFGVMVLITLGALVQQLVRLRINEALQLGGRE